MASAAQTARDLTDRSLEELTNLGLSNAPKDVEVSTAAKYEQKNSETPSTIRMVTAEDIKAYGYRTLAEILRSMPGIYVTNDRNYTYLGVRGFNRPGDYNSRILLMIDGERVNDNVDDSGYFGNEFLLDVDLIKRVEYMPGPGSAIYGNNAFFGVINVITKRGKDINGAELSGEYGGFDTYKARGSYGKRFANGSELLLSATGFDREGPDRLFFPEYNTPAQNNGYAEKLDYDRYQSMFAKYSYGPFILEGGYLDRTKGVPTASFQQIFNDKGSYTVDNPKFATLTFAKQIVSDWNAYLRLNYHENEYVGDYIVNSPPPRTVNRDFFLGEWWGGEFRLTNTTLRRHKIVVGSELQDNLRQDLNNANLGGAVFVNLPLSSTRYGAYVQDEYRIFDTLTLLGGYRYDYNPFGGPSTNPRVGLIWQALDTTTLKLLYGTAFRAPNAYELFYASPPNYIPSPNLKPEQIQTYEFSLDHLFTPSTRLAASVYRYNISDLVGASANVQGQRFFANMDKVTGTGIELEGEQRFQTGARVRFSYTWQNAENGMTRQRLTNSPEHMLKLNLVAPIWRDDWRLGLETQYTSSRRTDLSQVPSYVLSNLVLTGDALRNLQMSFGVYNLWNVRYADPVSIDYFKSDRVVQDGLNFRLKLSLKF